MIHPLLNTDSRHYDKPGEKPAILKLETQATLIEQIGWAKGNIFKYKARLGRKDSTTIAKDERKIETFENYLYILEDCKYKEESDTVYTRVALERHYPNLITDLPPEEEARS